MDRRELLAWLVSTGGVAALNRLSAHDLLALGREAHAMTGANPDAVASAAIGAPDILAVAAEHIIPATDTPGATDADVAPFIRRMLADWYPPADHARFTRGLQELDARSVARTGRPFVACDAADRLALLTESDAEVTALRRTDPEAANAHWFAMLKYLTVWGYCTSEVAMRDVLHTWPMPMRYDGNAPVGA